MQTRESDLGYLALPAGATHAGVVVVHDVWGLAEHTRDFARRFAVEGFVALAVNLYRKLGHVEITDPGSWMRNLSDPQVLGEIASAVRELREANGCTRVGVVGFCMGGSYALLAASGAPGMSARVDAAVPFYGILSHRHGLLHAPDGLDPEKKPCEPLAAARNLACPLLAFFGAEDPYIPLDDVDELKRALAGVGAPHEVVVYPNAGHAFMNDTRPQAYRPEVAADAWRKTITFLNTHLR